MAFTGGEPLLKVGLFEIMKHAAGLNAPVRQFGDGRFPLVHIHFHHDFTAITRKNLYKIIFCSYPRMPLAIGKVEVAKYSVPDS